MPARFYIFFLLAVLISVRTAAQLGQGTSNLQLGGGWSSVIIESNAETANGYIFNALYENWLVSPVGIGGSVHYLRVMDKSDTGSGYASSIPVYLNGKYYFGKEKIKVFVMGSLGFQFSWRKLEDISGNSGSDHDSGLTAGIGTGLVYTLSPKVLLNLNYSLYWLKNAYYSNGLANTVSFNLGYILGN
jgi:hypothetical protein